MGICIREEGHTCVSFEDLYFARNITSGKTIAFAPLELLQEEDEAEREILVMKLEKERLKSVLLPQRYFNKKMKKEQGEYNFYKIANAQTLKPNSLVSFQEVRNTLINFEKQTDEKPLRVLAVEHYGSRLVDLCVIPKAPFSYYTDGYPEELAR